MFTLFFLVRWSLISISNLAPIFNENSSEPQLFNANFWRYCSTTFGLATPQHVHQKNNHFPQYLSWQPSIQLALRGHLSRRWSEPSAGNGWEKTTHYDSAWSSWRSSFFSFSPLSYYCSPLSLWTIPVLFWPLEDLLGAKQYKNSVYFILPMRSKFGSRTYKTLSPFWLIHLVKDNCNRGLNTSWKKKVRLLKP